MPTAAILRLAALTVGCLLLPACCLDAEHRLVFSLACLNAGGEAANPGPAGAFGPPSNLQVSLSDDRIGAVAVHRLSCDVEAGAWQLLQGEIRYPSGFRLNESGFGSIGGSGSLVGLYQIDGDFDGIPDSSYPLRASSDFFAFLDLDLDGVEDPFEPQLALSQTAAMAPLLYLLAPLGGDDLAPRMLANRSFRASLELLAGPIENPLQAGRYPVQGQFESVDPDTGGASNGAGQPPLTLTHGIELSIGEGLLEDGFEGSLR